MRDTILLLLCGRAPADVPGQDQLCEPLEVGLHCVENIAL